MSLTKTESQLREHCHRLAETLRAEVRAKIKAEADVARLKAGLKHLQYHAVLEQSAHIAIRHLLDGKVAK